MSLSNFTKNLIELRKKNNLTQACLAEKLGLNRQTIANYEKGIREPDLINIIKISVFFNCSIDDLIFNGTNIEREEFSNLNEVENILTNLDSAEIIDTLIDKKVKLQSMYNMIPKKIKLIDSLVDALKEDFN